MIYRDKVKRICLMVCLILISLFILSMKNSVLASSNVNSKINYQVHHMSWRQKVGQMIICRNVPSNLNQAGNIIKHNYIGGVILYGYLNPHTISKYDKTIQSKSHHSLLIGTDQEGGEVSRLGYNLKKYPSPQEAYQRNGLYGILQAYRYSSRQLQKLGVNWNYAPDVDVSNPNGLMYLRTFGHGTLWTSICTHNVIPVIQHQHVAATLKHFPGYGSVKKNSDMQNAYSNRTLPYLEHHYFPPFKAGIQAGVDSIMVNNIIYNHIQPHTPATMSKRIINLLRKRLHFNGVIITDSLDTIPIINYSHNQHSSSAYLAIKAGNDMIMTHNYQQAINELIKDIKNGHLSKHQINKSVSRILMMKYKLGLDY